MLEITSRQPLEALCREYGVMLQPPARNQLYMRVVENEALRRLSRSLRDQGFYLVTVVSGDERGLMDHCFKLTYLFSHPAEDLFLLVENPLQDKRRDDEASLGSQPPLPVEETSYLTLSEDFTALAPFERESADMLGLYPQSDQAAQVRGGSWLHEECYPPDLYPLRRDQTVAQTRAQVEGYRRQTVEGHIALPPDGEWLLTVGPVHAGVIEPGQFLFRLGGEVVEELSIRLGYTHKGIERLFQTNFTLENGWRLAEHVVGDSAFAHSMAYCQAAEALAEVRPPREAELLRGLFLELERMANHIGDCGALAHDVASDVAASELVTLRERLLRLNHRLVGHRLLRGLNRPGGLVLPRPLDVAETRETVREIAGEFEGLAHSLAQVPTFRDRLQWVGILTRQQALALGTTGLVARASGMQRDFRLQHSMGVYKDERVQEFVMQGSPPDDSSIEAREATAGDSLARFLTRVHEVGNSAKIVEYILAQSELNAGGTYFVTTVEFQPEGNFTFGLGYVEGWRGDVVYWLMQDKFGRIFRCKVRDPSMLNWPALKAAVEPHALDEDYIARHKPPKMHTDSTTADFPIINKSFNLSYSGNDL
jgi:Ni,Fe-hydrogenase III large subunit/Ni,Fe-hydrogenase III component G